MVFGNLERGLCHLTRLDSSMLVGGRNKTGYPFDPKNILEGCHM